MNISEGPCFSTKDHFHVMWLLMLLGIGILVSFDLYSAFPSFLPFGLSIFYDSMLIFIVALLDTIYYFVISLIA